MKKLYSLLASIMLLLTVSSCEEDYRSMVLFEGVEPIYQIGTCDNLISSLTLYLTNPEGMVLGIDGGDGNYSLRDVDATVATVEFTDNMNGYRRLRIVPKETGVMNLIVADGSGSSTMLQIKVKDSFKYYFHVEDVAYIHTGDIDEDTWNAIVSGLDQQMTMKKQGIYQLIPSDPLSSSYSGGKLRVQTAPLAQGFFEGTFEIINGEGGSPVYRFIYNDEVHELFPNNPLSQPGTKNSPISPFVMYEDVTSYSPVAVPQGCEVYRLEKWIYLPDEYMVNGGAE